MHFSKFKKEAKRGAGVFPGWVCILAALTPALNKWKLIYFHSWKSYFCSFSFDSVFLIPLFIYLKGRPSCSFSTMARSGLSNQLITIPGGLWAGLECGSWGQDVHKTLLCLQFSSWVLPHAVMLPFHIPNHPWKDSQLWRGLADFLPIPQVLELSAWKSVNTNE